jgi:NADH-quinone oxidoreductase subunit G
MENDHELARAGVPKIGKPKHKDIGKHVILDAERCILCGRCVRFCKEVTGTSELTMTFRGDHEQVDISPERRLDNPYSVNVVDLCPVGALTFKDFRFKIRPWELTRTDTTCPGCAAGCAVELHTKHERAYRVYPRHDPKVNGYFMCDEGRFAYKELDEEQRILRATVDGKETGLDDALQETARRLKGKKAAVVFSAAATNEANLALAEVAKAIDAAVFLLGRPRGEGDETLRDEDKNPNTRGATNAIGKEVRHPDQLALDLAGGAFEAAIFLDGAGSLSDVAHEGMGKMVSVCLADRHTALADACAIRLPAASWAEILGTYTNRQGLLRAVHPAWRAEGDRKHRADLLRALLVAMDKEDTIGSARALTRSLAEAADDAHLLGVLDDNVDARPTLLRFANNRG